MIQMDPIVATLVRDCFHSSDGELLVGNLPVSALISRYGTPLFLYDASVLEKKWTLLRQTFPPRFKVCYSVKANPNQAFLRFFVSKGCGLEVASGGELYQALESGCAPDQIVYAGPGKTEAELEMALSKGIGEIHAESVMEIERLNALSRRLGICAKVALRVNPQGEAQGGAMRMGGKPVPFGIDEENLASVLEQVLANPSVQFRGIHLFAGTQILDYTILVAQYRKALEIARRAACQLGRPLHTVDFGGGLGVPYFPAEEPLDMLRLQMGLEGLMAEIANDPLLSGTEFLIEPGRYLVAEAGIYVTRVNDIKVSRGKKFLVVDGGMNHHLAASGNLGQTIKRNYPVAILNKLDGESQEQVDVVGPLCTPLDVVCRNGRLPHAEVGDLVGIFQSGAYARAASPLGFLSHATPPEVWVEREKDFLIRRRGTFADYLRDVRALEPSVAIAGDS